MHCFHYLISPSFLSQSLNFHCTCHSSGEPINRLVCLSHHNMHARIIRFQKNVCSWQCVFVFECVIREMERETLQLLSQRFIAGLFFFFFSFFGQICNTIVEYSCYNTLSLYILIFTDMSETAIFTLQKATQFN